MEEEGKAQSKGAKCLVYKGLARIKAGDNQGSNYKFRKYQQIQAQVRLNQIPKMDPMSV